MKIIGRYVLKEHLGPFVFASTALTSLMLLQYIAKKFGELVGKGLPSSVIAEFMLLSVPFTVAMTLPMAVLVAVLYAFSRLAAENEITALKASGVAMWGVLAPVLLGGFAMSLVMLAFNDQVLPRSNHRLAALQVDIFRTKPSFALREQVLNTVKEGQLYLRAGSIDEGTSDMKDVVIYDLSDPTRRRTIYAETGKLGIAPNQKDLDMTLFDGVMMEVPNNKPEELTRLYFKRDRLRTKNIFNAFEESKPGTLSKGDREMSICEMQAQLGRADLLVRQAEYDVEMVEYRRRMKSGKKPEQPNPGQRLSAARLYCQLFFMLTVSEAQARSAAAMPQQSQKAAPPQRAPSPGRRLFNRPPTQSPPAAPDTASRYAAEDPAQLQSDLQEAHFRRNEAVRMRNRYDVEIHKKFSLAAACVIFVLIGAPMALRFPRGGIGLVISFSFAIFGLYYVGLIGGETLADKGYLPPWVAMWAANIILLVVGLYLAARMGRESSSSRGGDFGEFLATARARIFGWLRGFGVPVERRRA